jgi:hypothetical protein
MPERDRPYKVWGYPWMPILVILFNAFYLLITLIDDIGNYVSGKNPINEFCFWDCNYCGGHSVIFLF